MDVLLTATRPEWVKVVLAHFDEVLVDHAHCERKAAASAMALVTMYPDHDELVRRMAKLAQEELRHFREVHAFLVARGVKLTRDRGDPYAQELLGCVRTSHDERRTDRLLVSAIIEARSSERLALIGEALDEEPLRGFYKALATAESGHYRLFAELAERYDEPARVRARLGELLKFEAELVARLPLEPRVH